MHAAPRQNASSRKPPITAAAILSASLLGLALAYCACTLMPLVAGQHAGDAAIPDSGSPETICYRGDPSISLNAGKANE